jgi:hypothetical protein
MAYLQQSKITLDSHRRPQFPPRAFRSGLDPNQKNFEVGCCQNFTRRASSLNLHNEQTLTLFISFSITRLIKTTMAAVSYNPLFHRFPSNSRKRMKRKTTLDIN